MLNGVNVIVKNNEHFELIVIKDIVDHIVWYSTFMFNKW